MPSVYKMIATVMLQNGFEPGFDWEETPKELLSLFQSPSNERYGLGYVPTDDEMKIKRNSEKTLVKLIPYLYNISSQGVW